MTRFSRQTIKTHQNVQMCGTKGKERREIIREDGASESCDSFTWSQLRWGASTASAHTQLDYNIDFYLSDFILSILATWEPEKGGWRIGILAANVFGVVDVVKTAVTSRNTVWWWRHPELSLSSLQRRLVVFPPPLPPLSLQGALASVAVRWH